MDSKKKDAKHAIEKKIQEINDQEYGKYGTHPDNQNKLLMKDMEELYKMCKDDEDCLHVKKYANDFDEVQEKKGHALHNAVLDKIREKLIKKRKEWIKDYLEQPKQDKKRKRSSKIIEDLTDLRDENLRYQLFAMNPTMNNVVLRVYLFCILFSRKLKQADEYIWDELKKERPYAHFFGQEEFKKAWEDHKEKITFTVVWLKNMEYNLIFSPERLIKCWKTIAGYAAEQTGKTQLQDLVEKEKDIKTLTIRLVAQLCLDDEDVNNEPAAGIKKEIKYERKGEANTQPKKEIKREPQ